MASLNKLTVSTYENLKGVDFSTPESLVDKNRSPYCLNLMPDASGNPVKRPGWKTVYKYDGRINGLWMCSVNGEKYTVCHAADKIYLLGKTEPLISGIANSRSSGFYAFNGEKGLFYILTSAEYLCFDGSSIAKVSDSAYIPLVAIAKSPEGGGESYENINFLTAARRENFIGTDKALVYQLGADKLDAVEKIEILQQDGSRKTLEKDVDYTADLVLGKITFVSAHPAVITGQDNIFVTYVKQVEGYKEKIIGCTVCAMYGLGGENRVFLSGNPSCPQKDFWSEVFNPSYFPDLNYAIVGSGQTAIMGYIKLGDQLGIVKEGNGQDISLYLRSASLEEDGRARFTVQGGVSGTGAVSKNCFALINDEPLYLSSTGVMGVVSNTVTSQRVVVNRSGQVDARLLAENNIKDAAGCVWKDFYIVAVNGNCYVLDSRQLVSPKDGDRNSGYEAYFWNNVPAVCFEVYRDELWFGTADGRVCCFKSETLGSECYSDDGEAIYAVWKTPVEDEGRIDRFKTLQRKGCLVTLRPFAASSCSVYMSVDGGAPRHVQSKTLDITPLFSNVDFERFTFNNNSTPQEIYFYTKMKRYKRIQLIFENNKVGEGFGIQKITKLYKLENYSKNRR